MTEFIDKPTLNPETHKAPSRLVMPEDIPNSQSDISSALENVQRVFPTAEYDGDAYDDEIDIVVEGTVLNPSDYEPRPLIPTEEIEANDVRDEAIRQRFVDSNAKLDEIDTYSRESLSERAQQMGKNAEEAKKDFNTRAYELREKSEAKIAAAAKIFYSYVDAVQNNYDRGISQAESAMRADVAHFESVTEATQMVLAVYEATMRTMRAELKSGSEYQAQSEKRRSSAIEMKNKRSSEYNKLLIDRKDATEKIEEYLEKLAKVEATRDEHKVRDHELRTEKREIIDDLAKEETDALLLSNGKSSGEEMGLGLNEAIRDIRRSVPETDDLKSVIEDLAVYHGLLVSDEKHIKGLNDLIDEKRVIINQIDHNLAELRDQIAFLDKKIEEEIPEALFNDHASAVLMSETERFRLIAHGDTSVAAEFQIPQTLERALEKTAQYKEIASTGEYTPGEFIVPQVRDFSIEDLAIRDGTDDAEELLLQLKIQSTLAHPKVQNAEKATRTLRHVGRIANKTILHGEKAVEIIRTTAEQAGQKINQTLGQKKD